VGWDRAMAITVTRSITKLTKFSFLPVPFVVDPADGTAQLAYTTFRIAHPDPTILKVGDEFTIDQAFTITVHPVAIRKIGVTLSADLIAHEQFHYDLGLCLARCHARDLEKMSVKVKAELGPKVLASRKLHFDTRAGLIQARYDKDTRHGTHEHYQKVYTNWMKTALGDPKATMLSGYYL
jgi:hypothetical protein